MTLPAPFQRMFFDPVLFPNQQAGFVDGSGRKVVWKGQRVREWYEIEESIVVRATEKAIRIRQEVGGMVGWIPRSQIVHEVSEIKKDAGVGDCGKLCVTEWFARQIGL